MSITGHDDLCPHPGQVQRILDPVICTYCGVIRQVRAQYEPQVSS